MKTAVVTVTVAALISLGAATQVHTQQPPVASELPRAGLAIVTIPARRGAKLQVSSPAFRQGSDIPLQNTQYGSNQFPGLAWSAGPAGTKSYVVIMQDPDFMVGDLPVLHWTMVNVPANVTRLDQGMRAEPAGARFGPSMRGRRQPYAGPKTPPGPKHRYHFQVFALDRTISRFAATSYSRMTAAMKNHVLASGETMGLGQAPPSGR